MLSCESALKKLQDQFGTSIQTLKQADNFDVYNMLLSFILHHFNLIPSTTQTSTRIMVLADDTHRKGSAGGVWH